MKAKQLINKITENWFAKIICVAIAVVFYMFYSFSSVEKKSFVIPLELKANGKMSTTQKIPQFVTVTIRGEPDKLNDISPNSIEAVVDISSYTTSGSYSVPINLNLDKNILQIDPLELYVKPEKIDMNLEESIIKYAKIIPSISGTPEHGYEQDRVEIEPEVVQIYGPETMVNSVDRIFTDEILLDGREDTFSKDAMLLNKNSLITLENGLYAKVTVHLKPTVIEKEFENCPIFFNALKENLEIKELPILSFKLSGTELALERYEPNEYTIQANCSFIEQVGEYEVPVTIVVPESMKVIQQSFETVKITIVEKEKVAVEEETVETEKSE